jgi:aromatic ring-opening dioxygenase catalytic subunit (LigB family)
MPLLGEPSHASMVEFLRGHKHRPSAVLIISAHWQCAVATLTSGARPPLIFDYGGFPPESYQYTYAARGDPGLAKRAAALLQTAGIAARLDESRGWDHGVFVPMMLMYPKAAVPIVCLSLLNDPDPARHLELGRILRPLRDEGVLILGSGSSYHNMGGFFGGVPNAAEASAAFDAYLTAACAAPAAERRKLLCNWERAPHARDCHPPQGEEHLLPLLVVAGAAYDDEPGTKLWTEPAYMGRVTMSSWGFAV